MKNPILALILALLAILGGAQAVVLIQSRRSAEELLEQRTRPIAERLEGLEASLARVLSRLEGLEASVREGHAARSPGAREEIARPADASSPDRSSEEGARVDEGVNPLIAALGKERAEEFRSFVADVVKEERAQRRAAERERALAEAREIEELNQGPFGEWNHRVNSVAKKLGLTDAQKQRYYDLLMDYVRRLKELREGYDRTDPEGRKAWREKRNELQEEFDGNVVVSFNPEQAEAYNDLPPHERSLSETPPFIEFITEGGDVMAGDPPPLPGEEGVMGIRIFQGDDLDGGPFGAPAPPDPGDTVDKRKILPGATPKREKPPL
jgi:hypothetical protein